jgi:hypothetical protein
VELDVTGSAPASAQRPRAAACGPVVSVFATGLNNPRGLTDFEPYWTWYSMIAIGRALYPMDSNHGELDRVTQADRISRVIDISASQGHVVPTALVHRGATYIANLGLFEASDQAATRRCGSSPTTGRSGCAQPGWRRSSGSPSAATSCTRWK